MKKHAISALILPVLITLISCVKITAQEQYFNVSKHEISTELKELIFGLQPTLYLNGNIAGKNYNLVPPSKSPVVIDCNSSFVDQLLLKNDLFLSVRAIKINIQSSEDLLNINLSNLKHFSSLECILITYTYPICGSNGDACLEALVKRDVQADQNPIKVLYQLSIPE